jgi:hypothetical protein
MPRLSANQQDNVIAAFQSLNDRQAEDGVTNLNSLLLDVCVFKVRFVSHFVCGTERLLSL